MTEGIALLGRPRQWLLVAITLVVLLLFLVYRRHSAQVYTTAAAEPASLLGRFAMTVKPGIHMLGGLSPSAVYVVETSEGLVLIDSGLDADARLVKSQMAELELDWRRIRVILLTHVHGDHTGGAESLRASTGARVYAGSGDATVMREGRSREAFFSTYFMPDHAPHPTTIDVALEGGEMITMGDVRIEAIAAPGHTPGSICYLIRRGGLRALFAGDVIMMLRGDEVPRTELGKPLGTYSAYLSPRYRGDARTSLATLRRLRSLPVPDLVLPGHPGADTTPQSPRLSQARWESLLDRGIRDMETVLSRYEVDGADFLDGTPRSLLPDLYYLGDFRGSAVYGLFAASRFLLVDAPGGPGLVEFVNARLRQLGREPVCPSVVWLTACGPEETAGLTELIEKCHPQVFASAAGLARLRDSCPAGTTLLPADELPGKGWFPVSPTAVDGRGIAPIGYRITWAGKTVLFSGRIPPKINQESGERLIADLMRPNADLRAYVQSLARLVAVKPDLWLPAAPVDGQNANLYDGDWQREIEENLRLIGMIVSRIPRR